jgi:hypothetical protein
MEYQRLKMKQILMLSDILQNISGMELYPRTLIMFILLTQEPLLELRIQNNVQIMKTDEQIQGPTWVAWNVDKKSMKIRGYCTMGLCSMKFRTCEEATYITYGYIIESLCRESNQQV